MLLSRKYKNTFHLHMKEIGFSGPKYEYYTTTKEKMCKYLEKKAHCKMDPEAHRVTHTLTHSHTHTHTHTHTQTHRHSQEHNDI